MRHAIITFAALSLAVSGCNALSGLPIRTSPPATQAPTTQATGSLHIHLGGDLRSVLSESGESYFLTLQVNHRSPYGNSVDWSRTVGPQAITDDTDLDVGEVPIGQVDLNLTLKNSDGQVIAAQQQTATLVPGQATSVAFEVSLGGSAAAGLGITTALNLISLRDFSVPDDQDQQFWNTSWRTTYEYEWEPALFELRSGDATYSISIYSGYDSASGNYNALYRRYSGLSETPELLSQPATDFFFYLPDTASWVDSSPILVSDYVRHFTWTADYQVSGQARRTLKVDRWYDPAFGLIKEVVAEPSGGPVLATMTRIPRGTGY